MEQYKNIILQQSIIKTLLYYDIFRYPLNSSEVYRFLGTNSITEGDVIQTLQQLVEQRKLFRFNDFFSLQPDSNLISRRVKGNQEAQNCLGLARKNALLISKFPFVRAVMISGSLSKGYMDKHSDIDFFIITAAKRLWVTRMLLVLYKRIFLLNSHKHFCVNYLLDEKHLEIEEKNIFTATELATVIPLYGSYYYHQLMETNLWVKKFFPNHHPHPTKNIPAGKAGWGKHLLENCMDIIAGPWLNKIFMRLTLRRWNKLYKNNYSKDDFNIAFKTKEYVSKNHPNYFQRKVMNLYQQKLDEFAEKFSIEWNV